jgi:hypothetical protein
MQNWQKVLFFSAFNSQRVHRWGDTKSDCQKYYLPLCLGLGLEGEREWECCNNFSPKSKVLYSPMFGFRLRESVCVCVCFVTILVQSPKGSKEKLYFVTIFYSKVLKDRKWDGLRSNKSSNVLRYKREQISWGLGFKVLVNFCTWFMELSIKSPSLWALIWPSDPCFVPNFFVSITQAKLGTLSWN